MSFPSTDSYWQEVRFFLEQHAQPQAAILAPNEFLEFFAGVYYYHVGHLLPVNHFDFVAFHKGMVGEIKPTFAIEIVQIFHPVFANEVFVIYAKTAILDLARLDRNAVESLVFQVEQALEQHTDSIATTQTGAAIITTQNRPDCLARSLPQILALNLPVVIIDDASVDEHRIKNQQIADRYQVPLLCLPQQRLRPSALNIGLSYWLADPRVTWISSFQDNVNVRADALEILQQIQDAIDRPLLTGNDAKEHMTLNEGVIENHTVLYKRSTAGVHFHAHRDYWSAVMPLPTPERFATQAAEQTNVGTNVGTDVGTNVGTDEDWWITSWSPQSITKRGGYVVCIPDLVSPFAVDEQTVVPLASTTNAPVLQLATPQLPDTTQPAKTNTTQPFNLAATQPENLSKNQTESVSTASLSLEGVKVLIDGYNLQLTKGTGIKTYGLSLIQALQQLDATVDVLLSRGGYKANEILDEVFFYDNMVKNQNLLVVLKGLIKTATGPFYRAKRRKSIGSYVVKRGQYNDDFLKYATSFNLPQCYDLANVLYKKLRIQTGITVPEKIDIWHATYPLPINVRNAKKITTVHDLIPLRLPYATLDNKEDFYFKVRDSLKDSAVTITVSEKSKEDLLTYFDVDPEKIVTTYQPIALEPLPVSSQEVTFYLKRYGLDYQKYLLFVGAIEPKKNVGRLLDAYASSSLDMPLIIVGKKGWLWEDEIGKLGYLFEDTDSPKRVKLLEYVSTESLRYLYRGAYALVFPSLYEGFGLPPVEAMNYGCPVITSNVSCLPEICGDAAVYVDPYDVRDIKERMEDLVGDRTHRDQLVKIGRQVAQNYSMENYLRRLYSAYMKAL